MAAAAGVQSLESGSGTSYPFSGICSALSFLEANGSQFAGVRANGNFKYQNSSTSISDACAEAQPCDPLDTDTWGLFQGTSSDSRVDVRIESGYDLRQVRSGFAEDGSPNYAADLGNSCDNLAVIVTEREGPKFGGVIGSSGHATTIRSVARVTRATTGDLAAALILLERSNCSVLTASGTNARVTVKGNGINPGIIHADSLGNPACGNSRIFEINGGAPPPRIVSERAQLVDPQTGVVAVGEITTRALTEETGAQPDKVNTPAPTTVCAQLLVGDCLGTSSVTGGGPTARELQGRARVDLRYRGSLSPRRGVIGLRAEAADSFSWSTDSQAIAAGYRPIGCAMPPADLPSTVTSVWANCNGGQFNHDGAFPAHIKNIVINGWVSLNGNNRVLTFEEPEKLFIRGRSGDLAFTPGNNSIRINIGASANCTARGAALPHLHEKRTKFVIGGGRISMQNGTLRMCQTTLLLADNHTGDCPIPSTNGTAPGPNGCSGNISLTGGTVDWSAPNVNNITAPTSDQLAHFEDLALWSETQGPSGSNTWDVGGGGGLFLSGIFFSPNADPFGLAGGGATDITGAQFITRRLVIKGNGLVELSPLPQNSVGVPRVAGISLVR
jgi:hypothetical protein